MSLKNNCSYYPCHKDINNEEFTCEFCYCPLYNIICPGEFLLVGKDHIKDCSLCTWVHKKNNLEEVRKYIDEVKSKI